MLPRNLQVTIVVRQIWGGDLVCFSKDGCVRWNRRCRLVLFHWESLGEANPGIATWFVSLEGRWRYKSGIITWFVSVLAAEGGEAVKGTWLVLLVA